MEKNSSSRVESMAIDGPESPRGSPMSFKMMLNESMEIDGLDYTQSSHSGIIMTSEKHGSGHMDIDTAEDRVENESNEDIEDIFEDDDDGDEDYIPTDMSDGELDDEYDDVWDDDTPTPKKVNEDAVNKEGSLPAILIGAEGTSTIICPDLSEAERQKITRSTRRGIVLYSELDIESIQINFRK